MGKRLGQHFLTSQRVIRVLTHTAQLKPTDTVLEIGPGNGILTQALLKTGAHVYAVEKDTTLVALLKKRFHKEIAGKRLTLIARDIRSVDTEDTINTPHKLVANIPYYITGEIIRRFLTAHHKPETMVLLIQKEVAERIVAKDGKESILSLSVQAYGTPQYIQTVTSSCFRPAPKVDSAVLSIDTISRDFFTKHSIAEETFFRVVKQGFAHKRKTIANNLSLPKEIFTDCGIDPQARAETLSLDTWAALAQNLSRNYGPHPEPTSGVICP